MLTLTMPTTLRDRVLASAADIDADISRRIATERRLPGAYGPRFDELQATAKSKATALRSLANVQDGTLIQFDAWLREACPTRYAIVSGSMLAELAVMFLAGKPVAEGYDWHYSEAVLAHAEYPDRDDDEPS